MCGIAGIFVPQGDNPDRLIDAVDKMVLAQDFRGPDGKGIWANSFIGLGCVRLAIVGNQSIAQQPLKDRWGNYTVFNGEIYEYKKILENLGEKVQPGISDGSALAATMALRGPQHLNYISGMFAAAHYTVSENKLTLIRDPLGKKPLYIKKLDRGWIFASSVSALRTVSDPFELRQDGIYEYLVFRSIGGYQSVFKDIEQVPPGSYIEFRNDGTTKQGKFWFPPKKKVFILDPDKQVREALEHSVLVRSEFESLPEVAVFLSGGLDSAIVAALLKKLRPNQKLRMCSVGYDVGGWQDERAFARKLADYFKAPFEELQLSSKNIPDLLEKASCLTEDPIQTPVVLSTLVLAQAARRFAKVAFCGEGSDEIWGGYERFVNVPVSIREYLTRTMVFQPSELGLSQFPESYLDNISYEEISEFPLDNAMKFELDNRFRNYHLARLDKISMGVGLETRCPFLDATAVSLGLSISSNVKRPSGIPKGLLHKAFHDVLPKWLIDRPKQPFTVPIKTWLEGDLYEFTCDTLLSSNAFVRQFINPHSLLSTLKKPSANVGAADRIWSLLQLEVWYQSFVKRKMSSC